MINEQNKLALAKHVHSIGVSITAIASIIETWETKPKTQRKKKASGKTTTQVQVSTPLNQSFVQPPANAPQPPTVNTQPQPQGPIYTPPQAPTQEAQAPAQKAQAPTQQASTQQAPGQITLDQVQEPLKKICETKGIEVASKLLKKFGAEGLNDVKPEHYPQLHS